MTLPVRFTTTSAAEGLPRRRFTVAEVEVMVAAGIMEEDERVELIGGELVPMSLKGSHHEELKNELLRRWYRLPIEDVDLVCATTLRLAEDTYLEPDIVVFSCAMGLSAAIETLSGKNALLVVEVADSSLHFDVGFKAALYAGFGVRELWVIDAVRLVTHVFREPSSDGYHAHRDIAAEEVATPLHAPATFALRLADLDI